MEEIRNLRVLLITSEYSEPAAGGAGVYAKELAKELANAGVFVCVIAPDNTSHVEIINSNLKVYYFRTIFKPILRMPSFSYQVFTNWAYIYKIEGINAIHSNNNAGVWTLGLKPMITSVQHLAYSDMKKFGLFQKVLNIIDILLERLVIKFSKAIIVTSHLVWEDIMMSYPNIKDKVRLVPIGIDFGWYRNDSNTKKLNSNIQILFPGGARGRRKGAEYLFPALKKIANSHHITCTITGISRELGWNNIFMKLIKTYALEKIVRLTGEVGYHELKTLYKKTDIVVFPSTFEGYGLPILETLSMQKPLVVSKVGEAPYIIKDKYNGLLVNTQSTGELVIAITALITDQRLRSHLIKNSRSSISNEYNWAVISKKLLSIYRSL